VACSGGPSLALCHWLVHDQLLTVKCSVLPQSMLAPEIVSPPQHVVAVDQPSNIAHCRGVSCFVFTPCVSVLALFHLHHTVTVNVYFCSSMILALNPNKGKELISSLQCPECHWCPPSLLFSGYGEPPPCAKVKNGWSCTSTPLLCLYDAYRATLPSCLSFYSRIVLAFPFILCVVCYYILLFWYIVLVYNLIVLLYCVSLSSYCFVILC
jgi:hypothetical protein